MMLAFEKSPHRGWILRLDRPSMVMGAILRGPSRFDRRPVWGWTLWAPAIPLWSPIDGEEEREDDARRALYNAAVRALRESVQELWEDIQDSDLLEIEEAGDGASLIGGGDPGEDGAPSSGGAAGGAPTGANDRDMGGHGGASPGLAGSDSGTGSPDDSPRSRWRRAVNDPDTEIEEDDE